MIKFVIHDLCNLIMVSPSLTPERKSREIQNLDVKNFPAGEYRIKVIARVPGIPAA